MTLPLDALREVQEGLSNNMWMLGLPELAPFRAFILDAAAQCEAGVVERALREVRREAKEEREEQQRQGRDETSGAESIHQGGRTAEGAHRLPAAPPALPTLPSRPPCPPCAHGPSQPRPHSPLLPTSSPQHPTTLGRRRRAGDRGDGASPGDGGPAPALSRQAPAEPGRHHAAATQLLAGTAALLWRHLLWRHFLWPCLPSGW